MCDEYDSVAGNLFLTISSGPKVTLHHMAEADPLAEGLVRHRAASSRVDRCACCVGIYKPTQDAEGLQRKTLEKTGNGIFQWCLRPPGQPVSPASELCNDLLSEAGHEAAASRQALSAARALEGLMDMEHRAVQPALDQLWTVIWKCALLDEGSKCPTCWPNLAHNHFFVGRAEHCNRLAMAWDEFWMSYASVLLLRYMQSSPVMYAFSIFFEACQNC